MEIENGREERESREEEISFPPSPSFHRTLKTEKGRQNPGGKAAINRRGRGERSEE